jgi:hypothetical protein
MRRGDDVMCLSVCMADVIVSAVLYVCLFGGCLSLYLFSGSRPVGATKGYAISNVNPGQLVTFVLWCKALRARWL